jgi:hypothetical protein
MINANIIPLEFWQDPQSDVIVIFSERECSVYFSCWTNAGEPADFIGKLSFNGAAAVRSFDREFNPYRYGGHRQKSYILQIPDSDLVRDRVEYRKRHYPKTPTAQRTHYVILGHDIYHEILAVSFTASTIPKVEVTESRLLALIAEE